MATPKTLLIVGAGRLGGFVLDSLSLRFPSHRFVLASRRLDATEKRVNLSRYLAAQWGKFPAISALQLDLTEVEATAESIGKLRPDVIFNATTPFPWWMIKELPPELADAANAAGPGTWAALDIILPLRLSEAIAASGEEPVFVNGCYPDMTNCFLSSSDAPPALGIGNLSNLIPGLRIAFGADSGMAPEEIDVRLVCHHFTSLNAPTAGSSLEVPYALRVKTGDETRTFSSGDDLPFQLIKNLASRTRGEEGQGVTGNSAATVLAAFLEGRDQILHAPGPAGLPGGYPVRIDSAGKVTPEVEPWLSLAHAVSINKSAQKFDGIEEVQPGRVALTSAAQAAMEEVLGFSVASLSQSDVASVASESIEQLQKAYSLEVTL